MTIDGERTLFREEAIAAYRTGSFLDEPPPPIRLPRWPLILLCTILLAALVAAATLPLPSFATAAPVGTRGDALTAVVPGVADPAPRAGQPGTLSAPGGARFEATVVATAVLRQQSELAGWGVDPGSTTPITVLALRPRDAALREVLAANVNKVDVRVSNATGLQRLAGQR